jgi:NAD(P)-dependent dehydrogenase (short-subunit alcohol dehydrogenase family)
LKIDLTGKRILVTGASRGIGKALAKGLASCGAVVGVHFNRHCEEGLALCREIGHAALPLRANLEEAGEPGRLFEDAVTAMGGLEVLVNNAGVAHPSSLDLPEEKWSEMWDRTHAVNLRAPAILCRAAILHFIESGGGRIVNISSRAAFRGDTPEYLAYAASKAGLVALTRSIARGYGKENVTAFLVAPGFVRTEMAQEFFDAYGESFALDDIALPRLTEPEDLVPFVALLASGLADHATGGTFDINAGSYVH